MPRASRANRSELFKITDSGSLSGVVKKLGFHNFYKEIPGRHLVPLAQFPGRFRFVAVRLILDKIAIL